MIKNKILQNKEDIKVGQILQVLVAVKGKLLTQERIVKEIYGDYIGFKSGDWLDAQVILDRVTVHIGQIKTFWKIFHYRHYF